MKPGIVQGPIQEPDVPATYNVFYIELFGCLFNFPPHYDKLRG